MEHIYFFSYYNVNGISTRYRGLYILESLFKNHAISSTFIYPGVKPVELLTFIKSYLEVVLFRRKNSLVIYQKLHSNGIYTQLLKLLLWLSPKDTIYDTDDADYLRYNDKQILHFIKNCEICTVGSKFLYNFVKNHNNNTLLLTSPVIAHQEIKKHKNEVLHLGWVGNYEWQDEKITAFSHKVSLFKYIFPSLLDFKFQIKLTLLGVTNTEDKQEIENFFSEYNNIHLDLPENIDWLDEIAVYNRIKEFDIGLSPLMDHPFNKAKSAFKAKQYLSCGVPVLASPVGENLTFMQNGKNGYLCRSKRDFEQRITEFEQMSPGRYLTFKEHSLQSISSFSMDNYCAGFTNGLNNWLEELTVSGTMK